MISKKSMQFRKSQWIKCKCMANITFPGREIWNAQQFTFQNCGICDLFGLDPANLTVWAGLWVHERCVLHFDRLYA